ncbi:TorF family putative porin [Dyella acidisoli]|uniref:MipA/OmpV family protein n=1 Tax=Dyella acidisoli TaxID=1867834 RepID=A0ABQ5XXB6_9GAMM|nr:TorF family putative porin [Dyella acidisoli]GLQ95055.1 hypothetical protein GCM10007901_40080 [Dyella acidisoli]
MTATHLLRSLPLAALSAALFTAPLHAQSNTLSGAVAVSSQLIDRGLAVSPVTPILQGNVTWTSASGWMLGLSAATETRSPGHGSEAMAQVAHYWSLTDDWRMQAGVVYYGYPGNPEGRPFDRVETGLNWMYRDVLSIGLAAITLTHGSDHSPTGAADVDFHWPLPQNFAVSAGLGVAQPLTRSGGYWGYVSGGAYNWYAYHRSERMRSYYGYGHVGLSWGYESWRVELDRVFTDPDIRRQGSAAAPWVATISWAF